ncbi:MAG TPA: hypothetical protein EYM65_07160 [Dehalococcoidia bacterium]|nr:hypothetical protein [Dehalococcoidia bacterium]
MNVNSHRDIGLGVGNPKILEGVHRLDVKANQGASTARFHILVRNHYLYLDGFLLKPGHQELGGFDLDPIRGR